MATQQSPIMINVPAGSDLSAKQFYFCDISSGNLAIAGAGTRVAGVLCNKPNASGVAGSLQIFGVAKVVAGGSISAGGGVASDASGKAVAASGSAYVCGIAMTDCSSGDIVGVLLTETSGVGLAANSEAISTAGALNPAIPTTLLTVSGTVAYTLADGTNVGQQKTIECVSASASPLGTVTFATASSSESTTHVFTAAGQRLTVEWRSDGWKVISKRRGGVQVVVVGTTVLTGYDMAATYKLSVTATVHSTTTKGIPNGQIPGEKIHIDVSTAASSPIGDIAITALTKTTSAAATSLANLTDTTMSLTAEWDGAAWQALEFTAGSGTATLS